MLGSPRLGDTPEVGPDLRVGVVELATHQGSSDFAFEVLSRHPLAVVLRAHPVVILLDEGVNLLESMTVLRLGEELLTHVLGNSLSVCL